MVTNLACVSVSRPALLVQKVYQARKTVIGVRMAVHVNVAAAQDFHQPGHVVHLAAPHLAADLGILCPEGHKTPVQLVQDVEFLRGRLLRGLPVWVPRCSWVLLQLQHGRWGSGLLAAQCRYIRHMVLAPRGDWSVHYAGLLLYLQQDSRLNLYRFVTAKSASSVYFCNSLLL